MASVRPPAQHFSLSRQSSSSSGEYSPTAPAVPARHSMSMDVPARHRSTSMEVHPSPRHSMSMDSGPRPVASVEIMRCLRCAKLVEATSTDDPSSTGMVRVGHNIYYCARCAKMTGWAEGQTRLPAC